MKKITYMLAAVLIIAGGIYAYDLQARKTIEEISQIKNVEALRTENNLPIVIESDIEYFAGAKGHFARPEAPGEYPGVVMIHENRGLRPETKAAAEQLAREGYMVLAVDLLGGPVETQEEARALSAAFKQEAGLANMKSAVKFLKAKGAVKIASLGWCFGGAQSLQLSLSEPLDATVIYYGRLATTTQALEPIGWPVLGIFGDQDQVISVESVSQFESALDELGVQNEIHMYKGVGHAFANPSGMSYAPNETRDAWDKTLAFLEEHLK